MSEIVYINFMREILCKFYVELIDYVKSNVKSYVKSYVIF